MSVRVQVSVHRKIGMPNFGSELASCSIDFEVDGSLLTSEQAFQQRVAEIFRLCDHAAEQQLELARTRPESGGLASQSDSPKLIPFGGQINASNKSDCFTIGSSSASHHEPAGNEAAAVQSNQGSANQGNANPGKPTSRAITDSQRRAILAMVRRMGLNVSELVREYGRAELD